jgi:hypothetical protein
MRQIFPPSVSERMDISKLLDVVAKAHTLAMRKKTCLKMSMLGIETGIY